MTYVPDYPPSRGRSTRRWKQLRQQILAANDVCHLCGKPGSTTLDHLRPRSLGGDPEDPMNLAPAHRSCNSARGNRPIEETRRSVRSREW